MTGQEFEAQVLFIARMLWTKDPSAGAQTIDGMERDGVFHEEDVIHLIESTIDKSQAKAKHDGKRLNKLASELRKSYPDKVVKCWFITKHEPTADQRSALKNMSYPVHAVSFTQLQSRLINAKEYILARKQHRFGSIHSPDDSNREVNYIPVELKERSTEATLGVREISRKIEAGETVCITADYGAGKSMILREIFNILADRYVSGKSVRFPVHINLREHSGAQYPDEILERHSRIIGFTSPPQLVRAWRAGYAIVLLDGFDEITSLGFNGKWAKLKDLRFKGLKAVRELISQQPAGTGAITAGREFYFDSHPELVSCLGLSNSIDLTLNDFTQEQIDNLLASVGVPTTITPAWLPKRPLFVATLALRGYLAEVGNLESSVGDGWNELIQKICERESRISGQLDAKTIRQVLERVATLSRTRDGGSFLSTSQLNQAFLDICGYEPDEQGVLLLGRLPGLGVSEHSSESRSFVDQDFECALGAAEVANYFMEPWNPSPDIEKTVRPLSPIGIAVAASILNKDQRSTTAQPAVDRSNPASALRLDLVQIGLSIGSKFTSNLAIRDLHIKELEISGTHKFDGIIYLTECIIDSLDVDPSSPICPKFRLQSCLVRSISGVHSKGDIPHLLDQDCMIEDYTDKVKTNAEILGSDISLPVRVLLVILRKLFIQTGRARRENAFYRGLDNNAQRYVSDVLDILISEGLTSRDKNGDEPLYIKNKQELPRIGRILSAPETSQDPLLARVRSIA